MAIVREGAEKQYKELGELLRETTSVIDYCEIAHLADANLAPKFLIDLTRKTLDHAHAILFPYQVDWSPVKAITALDQPSCRLRKVLWYIYDVQKVIMKLRLSLLVEEPVA